MIENAFVNFFLSFGPSAAAAAFIYFFIPLMYASIRKIVAADIYPDHTDLMVIKALRVIAGAALALGVIVAATSATVIPKNTVADPAGKIRQIESLDARRQPPEVGDLVDKTRQPKSTADERKAIFDAMVDYNR